MAFHIKSKFLLWQPKLHKLSFLSSDITYYIQYMCECECVCVCVCMCVHLVAQSCLTLCDLMDCSLPGPSVHGISQARKLEWVSIPFSRGSSQPGILTHVSCITGGFFTIWTIREVLISYYSSLVLSRVIRLSVPWTYFISSWLKDLHTYNYLYLGCPSYRLQHGSCPHITSMPMCL